MRTLSNNKIMLFQSTLSHGERRSLIIALAFFSISIHALAWGATAFYSLFLPLASIFPGDQIIYSKFIIVFRGNGHYLCRKRRTISANPPAF